MKKNDIPVFPGQQQRDEDGTWNQTWTPGMTIRQYATIELRIPDSGMDWLDEMIAKAARRDIAGHAMGEIVVGGGWGDYESLAEEAFKMADVMIVEAEK